MFENESETLGGHLTESKEFMKKTFLFLLCFFISTNLFAGYEEYHIQSKGDNSFKVLGRGVVNFIGLPLEIPVSGVREYQTHHRLWPITFIPRMISNILCRTASASNDTVILPWYAPFTNDTNPWTKGIGLPTYPWQANP